MSERLRAIVQQAVARHGEAPAERAVAYRAVRAAFSQISDGEDQASAAAFREALETAIADVERAYVDPPPAADPVLDAPGLPHSGLRGRLRAIRPPWRSFGAVPKPSLGSLSKPSLSRLAGLKRPALRKPDLATMPRPIAVAVVAVVLGFVIGLGFWLLAGDSPPRPVVAEQSSPPAPPPVPQAPDAAPPAAPQATSAPAVPAPPSTAEAPPATGVIVLFDGNDVAIFESADGSAAVPLEDDGTRFARFASAPGRNRPGGTTGSLYLALPPELERAASGERVRITVTARSAGERPSPAMAVAYSTNNVGNSGWQTLELGTEFADHAVEYDVRSDPAAPNGDFIGLWSDPEREGRSIDVARVTLEIVAP